MKCMKNIRTLFPKRRIKNNSDRHMRKRALPKGRAFLLRKFADYISNKAGIKFI